MKQRYFKNFYIVKKIFHIFLKYSHLIISNYKKNKCSNIASSLTYYTLLAIVPMIAISFFLANIFDLQELLEKGIFARFAGQKEVMEKIFEFVDNLLEKFKSGFFAAIGSLLLFISITKLFYHLENFFQNLWISRKRTLKNKISLYIILLLIVPVFLLLSGIFKLITVQKINFILNTFFPYVLTTFLFAFLYFFIPLSKFKFSSSLIAAMISGLLYEVFQWGYVYFQVNVTRFSFIYGSFAAFPLLLIWVEVSWVVFLFGAIISYCIENIKNVGDLSKRYKFYLLIWILYEMLQYKISQNKKIDYDFFKKIKIPYSISQKLINSLISYKLLIKKKKYFFINFDPKNITISEIYKKIEYQGINDLKYIQSKNFKKIKKFLEKKNWNVYLIDINKKI